MTTHVTVPHLDAPPTGRLQLALNVDDLDAAIAFYTKMFATRPNKVKPGYANFSIAEPPLKLVLFVGGGTPGTLNHLGVEVPNAAAVEAAETRLRSDGLETTGVEATKCCYAAKTETWVEAPDGQRWEWYVKQADVTGFACGSVETATETPVEPAAPIEPVVPRGCCG